ncbi:MAG: hypothetical protein ACE5NM_13665, partial [Sedimentisphaerales bacterium]
MSSINHGRQKTEVRRQKSEVRNQIFCPLFSVLCFLFLWACVFVVPLGTLCGCQPQEQADTSSMEASKREAALHQLL